MSLWLVVAAGRAAAAADPAAGASPDSASYWGPMPPPADSVTAVTHNSKKPAWEAALIVPYDIIALPFRGLGYGLGATVTYLDEKGVIATGRKLLGPRTGPFGVLLGFSAGGLSGFGVGLTVLDDAFLSPENRLKLRFQATVRGSRRVTMGLRLRDGHADSFQIGAGYRLQPNARYFGIGPFTPDEDESLYRQEVTWGGVTYTRQLPASFAGLASVIVSAIGARPSEEDDPPSLEEVFPNEIPAGFRDRSDGVTLSFVLRHETVPVEGRPTHGGVQRIKASYFEGTDDDDITFWTYRGEFEQFIPLWFSYRALGVRGYMSWIEQAGNDSIPFQRLMSNDEPDLLRGFHDFRWRDRGMTGLTFEYRWPIWANANAEATGLDAYLLADFGQVFSKLDEVGMRNLTDSYGFGIRMATVAGFVGRAEVSWSNEDTVFRLGSDQIFQFAKSGLYHGRTPVPTR
jgi:hypothetical protein